MPYSPVQPDRDGRHDEGVPEEESRRLGREVAAEILQEQVLLRLLLRAAFGRHSGNDHGAGETGGGVSVTSHQRRAESLFVIGFLN